jgi:hypothetical protein
LKSWEKVGNRKTAEPGNPENGKFGRERKFRKRGVGKLADGKNAI